MTWSEDDIDRDAISKEMDDARTTFHHLLDSADSAGLNRRSNGTPWTNEQLLFHMARSMSDPPDGIHSSKPP